MQNETKTYNDIGIVFIGPIVGLPPSLISAFDFFKNQGIAIEGIDIWEEQKIKKTLWNILGLTMLPGSYKKRVRFANDYNEIQLFDLVLNKIGILKNSGANKIIIGGMSGGFIFASRIMQKPLDNGVPILINTIQPYIKGLFGVSPLIFYPKEVTRQGADLELLPPSLPTFLIWGDNDTIIPKETIPKAKEISKKNTEIRTVVIKGSDVGQKDGSIKHQFFGGKDFVKPFKNIFWNEKAEKIAINHISDLIKLINIHK